MRALAIAMLALLCGCTTTEYVDRPVDVYVPVPTPCEVEVPAQVLYATDKLRASDTDFDKIKALLVERRQRAATEEALRLLLGACIEG
jgi:hypothetical protein